MKRTQTGRWGTVVLLILASVLYFAMRRSSEESPSPPGRDADPVTISESESGEDRILEAFENRSSGQWVEAHGIVERVLPDDDVGSRHQRFILKLAVGHTVLVSHNIDVADRVAGLRMGDHVAFRGEYEWNAQGGVVHWTHHDPTGRLRGGWLRHAGRTYK